MRILSERQLNKRTLQIVKDFNLKYEIVYFKAKRLLKALMRF